MRFVIQCVSHADVRVDGRIVGHIGKGFMVLIGISAEDSPATADRMIDKMLKLRIFEDESGKTNLNLASVGGNLLLISQFTLYADCKKGNRPSFIKAGSPEHALRLYNYIIDRCRSRVPEVATGEFGAEMSVSLTNEGPFTVILDSEEMGY